MPIKAYLDKEKYYAFSSTNAIQLKEDVDYTLEYILALLNSKLLNWYYANNFSNNSKLTVNISKTYLEKLPIKQASYTQQQSLSEKVNNMLYLNKLFLTLKSNDLLDKINVLNDEIDKEVYELYGLSSKEIELIENRV